jgi:hypothetical protein
MALGSQCAGIVGLVFASAGKLAVAGCATGLLGVAATSRLLAALLFGVGSFDPLVLTLGRSVRTAAGLASFVAARATVSLRQPHGRSAGGVTFDALARS